MTETSIGGVRVSGFGVRGEAHEGVQIVAAAGQTNPPRCIFISSIGCGGTSWLIKRMLIMIGGKASFTDYDKRGGTRGSSLPEGGWNTVAGLAVGLLGRLPDVGDEVTTNCCRLRVTVVRGRRVRRLEVQRLDS